MTLFYRQPGSPSLQHPPSLPIPKGQFSKVSSKDNLQITDLATYPDPKLNFMGGVLPHLCLFWRIMHEVGLAYNQDRGWVLEESRAAYFAEFKFRELLAWSDSLPPHLRCGDHKSHYAQILQ